MPSTIFYLQSLRFGVLLLLLLFFYVRFRVNAVFVSTGFEVNVYFPRATEFFCQLAFVLAGSTYSRSSAYDRLTYDQSSTKAELLVTLIVHLKLFIVQLKSLMTKLNPLDEGFDYGGKMLKCFKPEILIWNGLPNYPALSKMSSHASRPFAVIKQKNTYIHPFSDSLGLGSQ